jgi:hypothetical protein
MKKTWLWMATAAGMVIIAGGSVAVLADRTLNREADGRAHARTSALWFDCAEPVDADAEDRAREWRENRITDIREELGLDAAQVEQLRGAMEHHGELARVFWSATREDYCGMRDQLRDSVREMLDEGQKTRFERRLQRIDEKARARYNQGRAENEARRNKQR